MADQPSTKPQLPVHPLLANLAPSLRSPEPTVKLTGYVGPASRVGQVRLYHSLEDLSHYIEFDETAVVHTVPVSESGETNKGVSVWIKASTPVRWIREYRNAKSLVLKIARMASGVGVSGPPGVSDWSIIGQTTRWRGI